MLVALWRSNSQAFIDNNMNRLKAGAVLTVPSAAAAKETDATEAKQLIQAQSADFGAYRQRLASGAPAVKTSEPARQATGKVQAKVDDKKAPTAASPDRLTLSQGGVKAGAEASKASKEAETKEQSARVAELARNVEELKKLKDGTGLAASKPPATAAAPAKPAAADSAAKSGPAIVSRRAAVPPPPAKAPAPAAAPRRHRTAPPHRHLRLRLHLRLHLRLRRRAGTCTCTCTCAGTGTCARAGTCAVAAAPTPPAAGLARRHRQWQPSRRPHPSKKSPAWSLACSTAPLCCPVPAWSWHCWRDWAFTAGAAAPGQRVVRPRSSRAAFSPTRSSVPAAASASTRATPRVPLRR